MNAPSTPPVAIVGGGGHNGLVAGCYLARPGQPVLVLEAADKPRAAVGAMFRGMPYAPDQ